MLKSLGKDVVVYGVSDFLFKLLAFAVFPIYAHTFSVRDFGVIELVTVSSSLLGMFCMLGLNNSVQRFYWDPDIPAARQPAIVSTGLGIQIVVSSGMVVLLMGVLFPIRHAVETRYGIPWPVIVLALGAIVPTLALQFSLDVLRLHLAPWRFATVAFLRNVFGTAIGLALILIFGFGVSGVFAGSAVGAVAALPVALILIRRDLRLNFDRQTAGMLAQFGYPFVFMGMAYWIFGSLDRWMLAEMSDVKSVGLYGIAYKFSTILVFVNSAFGQAWSPWAMKIRTERADYREVYSQVLTLWFFALTILGVVLSLFSRELLILTTPAAYWGAANVLIVGVMGVVFSGTSQVTAVGIALERRTHLFATLSWLAAGTNFVLNLLLIPHLGALGAAASTTLTYLGLSAAYLYWTQRLHPLPIHWGRLSGIFLAGLLSMPIAWLLIDVRPGLLIYTVKVLIPAGLVVIAWRAGILSTLSAELRVRSAPEGTTIGGKP